ncbi:MAG TPA: protein-disulfide reductase DsbD domain-containing protein, partial [Gemmataceae bacterium]
LRTVKVFAMTLRTSPGSMPSIALALDELLDIADKDPTALAPAANSPAIDPTEKGRESASVVKAELKAGAVADGKQAFTVTLTIKEPWHLYANPVGNATFKESETSVEVSIGGKKVEAAIIFPKGKLVKDPKEGDYRVYEGTVAIAGTVARGKDSGALEVRVAVNACKGGKAGVCLQPSVLKLK